MKILYLGSMMSAKMADEITLQSRIKPSTAPVNFQRNLLKGFIGKPAELDIHSIPPVAMFPGSKLIAWGRRKEQYFGTLEGRFIPIINLPILKQLTTCTSTFFCVLAWCIRNAGEKEKCVLVYGQNVFSALPQTLLCRVFGVKSCNIITDPINYVSSFDAMPKWKKCLLRLQWSMMEGIKRCYSSFVLLTEAMITDYVTDNKPYILLEGIGDTAIFDQTPDCGKAEPPVIMYAGALTEGFGIQKYLEAIPQMKQRAQYWFFGAGGDCEKSIIEAEKENPQIRFWGKVVWEELLRHMKEASVLVSVKPLDQFHTRYQFPSKIMEYMASGTPTASTRVEGIPAEYFDYIYPIEGVDAQSIASSLDRILELSPVDRQNKGREARRFIEEKKNCYVQAERILNLLEQVVRQ